MSCHKTNRRTIAVNPKALLSQRLRPLVLSVIVSFSALTSACGTPNEEDFSFFVDDLFRQEVTSNTLTLHYTLSNPEAYGITEYTVDLGSCSPSSLRDQQDGLSSLKKQLGRFAHTSLSGSDALTYDVLQDYVDSQLSLSEYALYEDPLLPSGGEASQLPLLLAQFPLKNGQDISDYLNLLGQMDNYLDELLELEQERARKGLFMSDEICHEVLNMLEEFLSSEENHYLIKSFENRLDSVELSDSTKEIYLQENQRIVTELVLPAYRRLVNGLTPLMGSGRNDLGLCYYDDGKKYYESLVRCYTGCSDSMEELAERIESARNVDLASAANLVADDPELIEASEAYDWPYTDDLEMLDTLTGAMQQDFPTPPEITYEVSYVDPSMKQFLAPAFYITAPLDDYQSNTIYINSASDYSDIHYFTTLAHEGLPGHLYQTVMSYYYGMNPIRSLMTFPGYIEGWATYVELLSYRYAGLADNVADLLMHNQSAVLSLYASSDLGIHYFGWDMEQLYDFWAEYGLTDRGAIDEIAKLILSDPGNYLKYYVGYLNFLDLRSQMQKSYGDSFSMVKFHETLLRIGPASFSTIEKHFDEYYDIRDEGQGDLPTHSPHTPSIFAD